MKSYLKLEEKKIEALDTLDTKEEEIKTLRSSQLKISMQWNEWQKENLELKRTLQAKQQEIEAQKILIQEKDEDNNKLIAMLKGYDRNGKE